MDIQQIVQRQHDYFATGATLGVKGRLAALDRLRAAIEKYEGEINAALKAVSYTHLTLPTNRLV